MAVDLEKYRKKPTATSTGVNLEKYRKPAPEPKSFTKGLGNFAGGVLSGFSATGRNIQNALSAGVDKVFGTSGFGRATKEGFETSTGADLDTTSGKVGNVGGQALSFLGGGAPAKSGSLLARKGAEFTYNTALGTAQTGSLKEGAKTGALATGLGALATPLKGLGKAAAKLPIPLSKREAGMVQTYKASEPFIKRVGLAITGNSKGPTTAGETAFQKGLWGTESMIGVQAKKASKNVWSQTVAPALKVGGDVNLSSIFDDAQKTIIKNNPELNQQKALLNALQSIKADYANVLKTPMDNLQKLKEGWATPVPQKAWRGEDITGAVNNVRKTLADTARRTILTKINDPAVRQAYIDYGNLKGLTEWGQKAMTGGKFKGGAGSFISAAKDAIVTPVATIGGHVLYKTGQGIEFLAGPGAKTVLDIINEGSQSEQ